MNDEELNLHGELIDGLSEMIESGRLTEEMIPDDFEWLCKTLISIRESAAAFDDN